jgi:hypothetical protein
MRRHQGAPPKRAYGAATSRVTLRLWGSLMAKATCRAGDAVVFGAFVIVSAACHKPQEPPDAPTTFNCPVMGSPVVIMNNHHPDASHSLMIPAADILAMPPADQRYHIMGLASHDHIVTFTAADFMMLRMGMTGSVQVMETSTPYSFDGHTHVCVARC